jgi:hypothetical protein
VMGSWNAGGAGRVCVVSGVDVIYVCGSAREGGREGRTEDKKNGGCVVMCACVLWVVVNE